MQRFAPYADANDINLKMPHRAVAIMLENEPGNQRNISRHAPRPFYTDEVIDMLALYIDMLDLAVERGEDLRMDLVDFIDKVREHYLAGALIPESAEPRSSVKDREAAGDIPEAAPRRKPGRPRKQKSEADVAPPPAAPPVATTGEAPLKKRGRPPKKKAIVDAVVPKQSLPAGLVVGARVVWTPPPELQVPPARGIIVKTSADCTTCTLQCDDGQLVTNVACYGLELTTVEKDPLPDVPFDYDRNPITAMSELTYVVPDGVAEAVQAQLDLTIDDACNDDFFRLDLACAGYTVLLEVVIAVPKNVLLASLLRRDDESIVHTLPPRHALFGTYTFVDMAASCAVKLTVATQE